MAIKGKLKTELSIESVLERTSPYQIYKHFFGDFEINQVTCNHLRGDKNPSFIIGNKYGELSHYDFGNKDWSGDCFNLVKQIYTCDLHTALSIIDKDLNLGISEGREFVYTPKQENNKLEEVTKKNSLFQVVTRKFTKEELAYWNEYYQSEDDLKRENVYSIKKVFLNKKLLSVDDLRFGYFYEGFWKIYQPLSDKKRKWLTNVPLTYLEGKQNITDCDTAWVAKSKKDRMVLMKLYSCVAATQNESVTCFSKENVEFLKNNSKKQVIIYDSDPPGVDSCKIITDKFGFTYCNPPKKYLPLKDFADVAKLHGLKAIEQHFKEKGLI